MRIFTSMCAPMPVKNPCFQIQILPDSQFVLRRDGDGWEASFASVKDALDYADSLSAGGEAQVTVLDDEGIRFLRMIC